jgi:hypothetical protein
MALPPLELFSLEKRPPCCRVAFSFPLDNIPRLIFTRDRTLDTIRQGTCKRGRADVAQLVEQLIRNQQVIGSSPIVGSINSAASVLDQHTSAKDSSSCFPCSGIEFGT